MRKSISFALAVLSLTACTNRPIDTFAWNKATVYFVLVDRFCNGDSTNMAHYQKLCAFRKNHPAVGAGKQTVLNADRHSGPWQRHDSHRFESASRADHSCSICRRCASQKCV